MMRSAFELVDEAKATIEAVTPDQLAVEIAAGQVVVVDVRDSVDREHGGYIPGLNPHPPGCPGVRGGPHQPGKRRPAGSDAPGRGALRPRAGQRPCHG
jgi:rhodanese-related sulfurtransferase